MARKKSDKRTSEDDGDALWARIARTVTPHSKRDDRLPPHAPDTDDAPTPRSSSSAKSSSATSGPPGPESPAGAGPAPPRAAQPGPPPFPPPAAAPAPLTHGVAPGLDKRTAARLKRGLIPIDGTLDLHGMTRPQAQDTLTRYIEAQQGRGARCILVITGKGLNQGGEGSWTPGVLRTAVPDWLNQPPLRDLVLSFSYARPEHGGSGALYILLKRQR